MKKVFIMALAAAAMTLASCGGESKQANAEADSTSVETADSLQGTAAEAATAASSADAEIAALTQQLDSKDASQVKTTLQTIKDKITELSKTDPEAAKTYVEQLQAWLKTNASKVKEAAGGDTTVGTVVDALTTTSSAKLVEGYTKAKDAVESAIGTTTGEAATKASETLKDAKEVYDKAKDVTKEKVEEKAKEEVNKAKETGKAKAKEEVNKAVDKGLKSLGL